MTTQVQLRNLGFQDYSTSWQAMQAFTQQRTADSTDELWLVEHPPVYTLGLNSKPEHLLNTQNIPVIQTDRGGQVTYHGPGQLVIYTLLDITRRRLNVRQLVSLLENALLSTLIQYGIKAYAKPEAPGIYIADKKLGSIGLRVKQGRCYHGLSLNNAMDLTPFQGINTCGFPGLIVTQLADLGIHIKTHELAIPVIHALTQHLL